MSGTKLLSRRNKLLLTTATALLYAGQVQAQAIEIITDTTTSVSTSTADDSSAGDITITAAGEISTTDATALTLDSDNTVAVDGEILYTDTDDVTGVNIQAGNTGGYSQSGNIVINETYERTTNDSGVLEGVFAEGTGRTGILISGTGAFTGDVTANGILFTAATDTEVATTTSASNIAIQGNNSIGINLLDTASLIGNLTADGAISMAGADTVGINLAGDVDGDVLMGGSIATQGDNTQSINIAGDVSGAVNLKGTVSNTGYTYSTRLTETGRDLLTDENKLQSGSAITIGGNVGGGIHFDLIPTVFAADAVEAVEAVAATATTEAVEAVEASDAVEAVAGSTPSINQFGGEPAVLITGNGTPILIGLVADITDSSDEDYDADLQYGFINEGTITSAGILDDIGATGIRIQDATIVGGFSNTGTISSTSYRSGISDAATNDGSDLAHAYGVRIGTGSSIAQFSNSGTISATANESTDVYTDVDNTQEPNSVFATALSLEAGAQLLTFNNTGVLAAALTGREGAAYALLDASGNLATITNEGYIQVSGVTSDTDASSTDAAPVFTLVAIDVSANTSGVTITQQQAVDEDPDDSFTPVTPRIFGDVLFGSGADSLTSTDGIIVSNVSFGAGADVLALDGSAFLGGITDSDGQLTVSLANESSLRPTGADTLEVTSLSVDDTSTLYTYLDGVTDASLTNPASTITASGDITFDDGALLTPILADIISGDEYVFGAAQDTDTYTILEAGGALTIAGGVDSLQPETTPHLYDVSYNISGQTLVAELTLRDPAVLGLDTAQLGTQNEVYGSVLAALRDNSDLGGAFASLTDEASFIAAYNQVLPEFSAAATQFVGSNIDGATGSVATHLNNARLSNEKPGGAWIEEFGYFADRSQNEQSEAYRGYGFGFTGGIDTEWGPFHTIGLNFGFGATEIEDVLGIDEPLALNTFQTGLYAGQSYGKLSIDGYLGGGISTFESNRGVEIGDYSSSTKGEWSGMHYNGALNVGYDLFAGEKYFLRPSLNVSYMSMTEDGYTESGDDEIRLSIGERTSETGSATAMLNFGARWETDNNTWWRPSARLGFRNDFSGGGVATIASFQNSDTFFTLRSADLPSEALIFGLSIAMGTKYSSFGFDYDADMRDGYGLHTARIVLRMLF